MGKIVFVLYCVVYFCIVLCISGSSHITQQEIMEYSQVDFSDDDLLLERDDNRNHPELTDDDSSDDTDI